MGWRHIAFRLLVVFPGNELVELALQKGLGGGVQQVQALFVDQHGLVFQPVLPGLARYGVEDVLAAGAGVGRCGQAFHFFLVFAAEHGAAHGDSCRSWSMSFLTGAASPRSWICCLLYQTCPAASMMLSGRRRSCTRTGWISR